MSIYHLEIKNLSRGKGNSMAAAVSYIGGTKLRDNYRNVDHYKRRTDLIVASLVLPDNCPEAFENMQTLCDEVENKEKRYDARLAKCFIGSLPNELSTDEHIEIVENFVFENFVNLGYIAIVAVHSGTNDKDPKRNNPHVHIIVPTRTFDETGFSNIKPREFNRKDLIYIWRERWAKEINLAYERNGHDIRVSHQSLEVQGIDREPTCHISQRDWRLECRGEQTDAGNKKRAIKARNEEKARLKELERCLNEHEISRTHSR